MRPRLATDTLRATPPTLRHGADGMVTGTTGCNTDNGAYPVDGAALTFGPLALTMMASEGPVGGQETAFTAALQASTTWTVAADGTLTLMGGGDIVAAPVS